MAATVSIDRPPVARATVSRRRSAKPATVSASALALHLDCSRTYIGKLEAEGVIQPQGDGFPLDQIRVAYLRYSRGVRRQSLQSAAASRSPPQHLQMSAPLTCLRKKGGPEASPPLAFQFGWHSRPQETGLICAMLGELLNFLPGS
jgi:hypothetical protein